MDVNKVLTRINEDNLEELLPENGIPIVLACIRHDENLKEVLTTLAKVAHWFGNAVRSCYALEDMAPYFMEGSCSEYCAAKKQRKTW